MKAARTPLSPEKLAIKKQQADEALGEFLWHAELDLEDFENLWWARERWNQHYRIVSSVRYRPLTYEADPLISLSVSHPSLSCLLLPARLTSLSSQEETGRAGLLL
jgi:hypothetical protein